MERQLFGCTSGYGLRLASLLISLRSAWFLWNFLTCELVLCLPIFDGVVHRPLVSPCRVCDATAFALTEIVRCGFFLLPVW